MTYSIEWSVLVGKERLLNEYIIASSFDPDRLYRQAIRRANESYGNERTTTSIEQHQGRKEVDADISARATKPYRITISIHDERPLKKVDEIWKGLTKEGRKDIRVMVTLRLEVRSRVEPTTPATQRMKVSSTMRQKEQENVFAAAE